MPKIKTSELSGAALDWAVAVSVNGEPAFVDVFGADMLGRSIARHVATGYIQPSTDWCQGGPLIDSYVCSVESWRISDGSGYRAKSVTSYGFGESILVAACRAIVSAHLGDEVDIPEELVCSNTP